MAPLIAKGVTPTPLDGTVKPLGSFAEARAEMAAEQTALRKKNAGSGGDQWPEAWIQDVKRKAVSITADGFWVHLLAALLRQRPRLSS